MKKKSWKKHIEYWLDSLLEQGTAVMLLLLFLVVVIVSCIIGIIVSLICGVSFDEGIWNSFMHSLDAGNLAGNDLGNKANIVLMTVMTAFGLCFTGGLIGIINNSFEQKVRDWQKGSSKVMEKGHVVVLGYNDTLFNIVDSLVEANSNHRKQYVVVVGDKDNETMNAEIKANVKDRQTTRIICRSGKIYEKNMFDLASVEDARAVIINGKDDKLAIKSLLAVKSYLEDNGKDLEKRPESNDKGKAFPQVTVVINDEKYYEAAKKEGGKWAKVIYGKDAISRIIAHSCNQRGLSKVFDELFDYKENEIYFESIKEATGKYFEDVVFMFNKSIPLGIYSPYEKEGERVKLYPKSQNMKVKEDDKIIMFEEDDGAYKDQLFNKESEFKKTKIQNELINKEAVKSRNMMDLLILGQNDSLGEILEEYASVMSERTTVRIIDKAPQLKNKLGEYETIYYTYIPVDDFSADTIMNNIGEKDFNVLVLADYDLDYEDADAESILKLIELKTVAEKTGKRFATTCEIRKSANKPLAEIIGAENFVISSNIGGLMSVQCAENFELYEVFKELLSAKGSELYMKPAEDFVKIGEQVNFNTILEAALEKQSICLGYYKQGKIKDFCTCPDRTTEIKFEKDDTLIILSEN